MTHPTPDQTFTVSEFARLAGVTVRTLHYYDRNGLLTPAHRTRSGHRRYDQSDLLRLQQILTFKHMGFSLSEIKDLLNSPGYDLRESLKIQKQAIDAEIVRLQRVSMAMTHVLATLTPVPDWQLICEIIQGVTQDGREEWLNRYYTPAQQSQLAERLRHLDPSDLSAVYQQWQAVFAGFDEHRDKAPDHPIVQELAQQVDALVEQFTGGDPAIETSLEALYSDPESIPPAFQMNQMGDESLRDFIQQALSHYRQNNNA